jgi:thiamine pyrophosphate-dependent acetolactate synthase large subunit-like protein
MKPKPQSSTPAPPSNRIQRRPFVADLLSRRNSALIVPGLGSPTWDCFAAGDSPEYLYSWGGMGLAVPTALGLALAQPQRRVLALTGDGEMMMGIGALGVVADQAPPNWPADWAHRCEDRSRRRGEGLWHRQNAAGCGAGAAR